MRQLKQSKIENLDEFVLIVIIMMLYNFEK